MHDKVKCRNIDSLHISRCHRASCAANCATVSLEVPAVSIAVNLCLVFSCMTRSFLSFDVAFTFFSGTTLRNTNNVWKHPEQAEGSTSVTRYQRFVKGPWQTAARIFHSVFMVKHICTRVHDLLGHRSAARDNSSTSPVCRSSHEATPTARHTPSGTKPNAARVPANTAWISCGRTALRKQRRRCAAMRPIQ